MDTMTNYHKLCSFKNIFYNKLILNTGAQKYKIKVSEGLYSF